MLRVRPVVAELLDLEGAVMGFLAGDVVVQEVDATRWQLRSPLVYEGAERVFTVPTGFLTDFASVPRLVVWLVPRYGAYTRAAILHDYLCDTRPVSRADADGILRRAMHELGVSVPQRWMVWAAVRAASRMTQATGGQWLAFLLVAPLSLLFVAVPAAVVQLFLVLFWVIELIFWVGNRLFGDARPPLPRVQVRTS